MTQAREGTAEGRYDRAAVKQELVRESRLEDRSAPPESADESGDAP